MENNRKVNPEIREKIIRLIHKQLDEVGGEDIFFNYGNYHPNRPYYTSNLVTKSNVDVIEKKDVDFIYFSLTFEDGQPDITVRTGFDIYDEAKELYKIAWTWRGRKKFYTESRKFKVYTSITCGHIYFILTSEEAEELFNKTKQAWNKYQSLKDKTLDDKVLDKINMRLKR